MDFAFFAFNYDTQIHLFIVPVYVNCFVYKTSSFWFFWRKTVRSVFFTIAILTVFQSCSDCLPAQWLAVQQKEFRSKRHRLSVLPLCLERRGLGKTAYDLFKWNVFAVSIVY